MHSLRVRLLVGVIGGMVLLLSVFGIVAYTAISNSLINQFDTLLASMAHMLAASVEMDDGRVEMELDIQQMPEFQNRRNPTYYQLWRHDGTVVARSALLGTENLARIEGTLNKSIFRALPVRDGRPRRAVCLKFIPRRPDGTHSSSPQPPQQQALTLVVARDASNLQYQLSSLRWLLLIVSIAVIILSFLVAGLVVRHGLRPLNHIAGEIAGIREDNLKARIGAQPIPAEMTPIKNRLNELLSRLEDSFNRERRFTADVAHELRTPLSGLRSALEVTLSRIRDVHDYQNSLSECLLITRDMQRLVDNLLALSRVDAQQMTFRHERVQLAELVHRCWRAFSDRARQRNITFDNRIGAELNCVSDPESLAMVLSNLLGNAVEYTNQAGQIWVEARQSREAVELTMANTGCQLTAEQARQVFDCFWRGDPSRTDTGAHCGLGLALVQRLVRALGGSANVGVLPGGIFAIYLVLPVWENLPNSSS